MNSKTAKLIRRFATVKGSRTRLVKRLWNATPSIKRKALRDHMKSRLRQ